MTRINIIPVNELTDQHLVAEYREIFMIAGSLRRTKNSKRGLLKEDIPNEYRLNAGHVMFFYDKADY